MNNKHSHYHNENEDRYKKISSKLNSIIKYLKTIMTKQELMNLNLAGLDEATNAIAKRLQNLIDQGADNISQESLDALSKDVDTLRQLGTVPIK